MSIFLTVLQNLKLTNYGLSGPIAINYLNSRHIIKKNEVQRVILYKKNARCINRYTFFVNSLRT